MILIGNYPPDKQESMARFAQMLEKGFNDAGLASTTWKPVVFFGSLAKSTISGFGKWLGYLDKWVVFPIIIRWKCRSKSLKKKNVRFHICDHSNSPYLESLPHDRTAITCHDVLAIRGALGYKDAFCSATRFGKILQKWILRNLTNARKIACVSHLTLKHLQEITSAVAVAKNKDWRVIHNAFNAVFERVTRNKALSILAKDGIGVGAPFILHVGSSLPRKNRKLLLYMVAALEKKYTGQICFAGEAIDDELQQHAEKLGLQERIISVPKPDHVTLNALYSACDAFVFPSLSEGFGWPLIEAQACGAPVIASNAEPMPEVSGGAALHANPQNPNNFATAFLSLNDKTTREKVIEAGLINSRRFNKDGMIKSYLLLHGLLI